MEFIHHQYNELVSNTNSSARRSTTKRKRNQVKEEFQFIDGVQPPAKTRNQANARERDRTHRTNLNKWKTINVNSAFTALRTLIPTEPRDRKLSKIEILRLSTSYIAHLATQLLAGPVEQPCLTIGSNSMLLQNNENSQHSRHKVCTFCISHKKSVKFTEKSDHFECSNVEAQVFLNPPSTTSLYQKNTNILNPITTYY